MGGYIEAFDRLLAQLDGILADGGNVLGEEPAVLEAVRETRDFWTDRPTQDEYERLPAEIREAYREVVREIETEWGKSNFVTTEEERSLAPPFAIEANGWKRGNSVACVFYEHQDTELPIVVALAVFDVDYLKRLAEE